jgi:hypothetical protein
MMPEKERKSKSWHNHELKIEKALVAYFESKNYIVRTHSCIDMFDVVCSKVDNKNQVSEIIGIEIKSSKDRLAKLKEQLPEYIHVFDKVFIALESQNCALSLPFFIGIIKYDQDAINFERDAIEVSGSLFPSKVVTASALRRTIGLSEGIKSRHAELSLFFEALENLRRKIIYNSIFFDNSLPLSAEERTLVNFIIDKNVKELRESKIFKYDFGEVILNRE